MTACGIHEQGDLVELMTRDNTIRNPFLENGPLKFATLDKQIRRDKKFQAAFRKQSVLSICARGRGVPAGPAGPDAEAALGAQDAVRASRPASATSAAAVSMFFLSKEHVRFSCIEYSRRVSHTKMILSV